MVLKSHPIPDLRLDAWQLHEAEACDDSDSIKGVKDASRLDATWEIFWQQEAQHNTEMLTTRHAQVSSLRQQLAGKRHDNAVLIESISTLQQEVMILQQHLGNLEASPPACSSSRLPPRCPPTKKQLLAQLASLHMSYDNNQASLSELQHELSVLEAIPEGSVGRIVAGDTLLGDLQDTEQQLAAELESIRQEAAQDQATISQLQAEVMQLQSAGAFWEREASLAAQLREAEELTASLQHTLQEMGISTSSSSSQEDIFTFEKQPVQQEASSSSSSNGLENCVASGPRTPALLSDDGSDE